MQESRKLSCASSQESGMTISGFQNESLPFPPLLNKKEIFGTFSVLFSYKMARLSPLQIKTEKMVGGCLECVSIGGNGSNREKQQNTW